jgi:intracellular septation protein A
VEVLLHILGFCIIDKAMSMDQNTSSSANRSRSQSLATIIVLDIVGPLLAYYALLSLGLTSVGALILSGMLPAIGIGIGFVRDRRLDAIGFVVLLGIIVGAVLGLISNNARLVLIDGVVPTAVFGAVCIGSLWSERPMIYRFAIETMGADSHRGRQFADQWRYPAFRRAFRIATIVWGTAFLLEAILQVFIVETTSLDFAKTTSNVLPPVVAGLVITWNVHYAKRGRRISQQARAARKNGQV